MKKRKLKDLSGDGKITRKDVLIGRGVIKKKNGGELDIKKAIKKPGALRKSLGVKKGEKIPGGVEPQVTLLRHLIVNQYE